MAVVLVMLVVMAFVMMVQLRSFGSLRSSSVLRRLVLLASLRRSGIRGTLGFVALLGVLADRYHHRNSVILVTQIDDISLRGAALGRRRATVCDCVGRSCSPPRLLVRHDPDRAGDFLGADGLCNDRRHSRRHRADPDLPAGAHRRVSDRSPRRTARSRSANPSGGFQLTIGRMPDCVIFGGELAAWMVGR